MRGNKFSPRYPDRSAVDRDWLPIVVFLTAGIGLIAALLHFAWSIAA